jgi:hypothetical protein
MPVSDVFLSEKKMVFLYEIAPPANKIKGNGHLTGIYMENSNSIGIMSRLAEIYRN